VKDGIHPTYGPVVFTDTSTGRSFLTRSTLAGSVTDTVEWTDGRTYPQVRVDITNESHPFWTGSQRVLDTAGQVEKFRRRYGERPGRR
jgi:large subunit ribosomal protein L31